MKKNIILIIFLIVVVLVVIFRDNLLKIIYPKTYENIITIYADRYDVDKDLVFALIKSESDFDSKVKSNKGAIGLMQLMKQTAIEIAPTIDLKIQNNEMENSLLNPETNINIGTKYLQTLLERYNSIELALTAYNAGAGNVDKWIEQGLLKKDGSNIEKVPFKETNRYVRSILRDYKIYKKIYYKDKINKEA